MAHVAISRDFIARVQNKITVMRNAEVNALGKVPQISVPVDSDVVVKTVWGDYLHLREKIPASWKNNSDACRLTMRTTTTTKNDAGEDCPVEYQFSVNAPPNCRFDFPPNYHWHTRTVMSDELTKHPDIKEAVAYGNAYMEVEHRWQNISKKVVEFFQSCKSMKEAVTLWPECKMYIDSDDIKRYETKVVKTASADSRAAQVLATIGTDELVGAAIAARFQGAK